MKAILISIKPKYVAEILNGNKTIEIRKTMPKCDLPIDVYIYCTKDKENKLCYVDYRPYGNEGYLTTKLDCEDEKLNGKVVAKFTLKKISVIHDFLGGLELTEIRDRHTTILNEDAILKSSCLTKEELYKYGGSFVWHISNLVIFDKPKELSEFRYATCPRTNCEYCKYNKTVDGNLYCTRKTLTKAPQSFMFIETEN